MPITENLTAASGALGLDDPTLGLGLEGVTDWTPQMPFLDQMKTSRPFFSNGYSNDELVSGGYLDENGWPTEIPPGGGLVGTFFAWGDFQSGPSHAGVYVLEYEGEGIIDLPGGGITVLSSEPGRITFQSSGNNFGLNILSTDPGGTGDYIRNISIVAEEHYELYEAGAVFNPDWLDVIQDVRQVRFMDWMNANGSTRTDWDERIGVDHASWVEFDGVPVEIMVQLANEIGADPWFNLPHLASDEYIREFATYVRDNLDPRLQASFELSNETWNYSFEQTIDLNQAGRDAWGADSWGGYYVKEAVNMAQILDDVYGSEADARLVKVLGGFTPVPWLTEQYLESTDWFQYEPDTAVRAADVFDAVAVTTYFGISVTSDELRPQLLAAIEDPNVDAQAWLTELLRTDETLEDSLPGLANLLAQNQQLVNSYGLDLVAYEGGQHVHHAVYGVSQAEQQILLDFFTDYVRSDDMVSLYEDLWAMWEQNGDGAFMQFVDVGNVTQYGSWGLLNSLDDSTARADYLFEQNETVGNWWGR